MARTEVDCSAYEGEDKLWTPFIQMRTEEKTFDMICDHSFESEEDAKEFLLFLTEAIRGGKKTQSRPVTLNAQREGTDGSGPN